MVYILTLSINRVLNLIIKFHFLVIPIPLKHLIRKFIIHPINLINFIILINLLHLINLTYHFHYSFIPNTLINQLD